MRISDWSSDVCSSDLVSNDTPVLDDTTPIRAVLGDAADAITPVFEVRIERRTWIISEGGATIELVLDSGEVVAGERTSPICEIELELKQGDPGALFARSEEHTSELPSLMRTSYAVVCLEKKKAQH